MVLSEPKHYSEGSSQVIAAVPLHIAWWDSVLYSMTISNFGQVPLKYL